MYTGLHIVVAVLLAAPVADTVAPDTVASDTNGHIEEPGDTGTTAQSNQTDVDSVPARPACGVVRREERVVVTWGDCSAP